VLDDLPARLRARVAAISPEIGFLDLTPALAAEAARGQLVYFADDTHWSAEGHRAAGRAIADDVARRGGLGSPPHSSSKRDDPIAGSEDGSRL
jgi:lysophospholipase L1-like esterase